MNQAVLAIFALTYLGIAVGRVPGLKLDRTGIAILGAIAVAVFSGLPTTDFISFINWPTILLLFGFFVLSAQLRLSGFFDFIAGAIARRRGSPAGFLLTLMVATAALSAFLNHDIVCFVFTPVVGAALLRAKLNPVPFLVALAIASNIGSAATFVGNPQDMLIAQVAGLSFGRYALWCLAPVLFALACAYAVIWGLSRHQLAPTAAPPDTTSPTYPFNRPHTIKGLVILAAVMALFFTPLPKELIALTAAGIHLASRKFRTKDLLALVDWPILLLFISLFVVTGAFQTTGYGARGAWAGRRRAEPAIRSGADGRHRRLFQSRQQLRHRHAVAQGRERHAAARGVCAGPGQQFRRQPHHRRQRCEHHRGPAGARWESTSRSAPSPGWACRSRWRRWPAWWPGRW